MNCPVCTKPMEQESQHEASVMGIGKTYDHQTKKWIIPSKVVMSFTRVFWCRQEGCNMGNKYTFIDGNYTYYLASEVNGLLINFQKGLDELT